VQATSTPLGRRAALGGIVAFTAVLALADQSRAQDSPEGVVEDLVGQIVELLQSDDLSGRDGIRRLAETIDQDTDLDRLGRLVLGRHWRTASDEQRAEYETLFRELMLSKFVGHLGAFAGSDLQASDDLFAVRGSRPIGGNDVIVDSVVRPPDRPPLDVAWRLRGGDDESWVIIDLIVENVSLLISQRSEFSSVIESSGIDGLLNEMRQRLQQSPS
jgi:phospholipid transport system substrate-binding protein